MPLTEDEIIKIRAFYASVSSGIPGFKTRLGQRQMIASVSKTLAEAKDENDSNRDGSNICVIEGRTGVGKTYGFLVPALILLLQQDKKLIISSATVALQEQLFDRDIPSILQHFDDKDKIKYVIAKGRNRYACTSRLKNVTNTSSNNDMFEVTWERPPRKDETEILFKLAKAIDSDWNGDRDDLSYAVPDDLWARITNDSHGCSGKNCSYHDVCPFVISRTKLRSANLIVTNHDFLLTSLKVDSKGLPEIEKCIVIIDEAHHIPDITLRRFAVSHSVRSASIWLGKMTGIFEKIELTLKGTVSLSEASSYAKYLHEQITQLHGALVNSNLFKESKAYRYPHGRLEPGIQSMADNLVKITNSALKSINKGVEEVEALRKESTFPMELLNRVQEEVGSYLSKMENLYQTWKLFSDSSDEPVAKWIESIGDDDFLVAASPLTAGNTLSKIIWDKASSVVLASATVTTLGTFDFFLKNTGLDRYSGVQTVCVKSPFDFQNQGQIYLPRMRNDPKNADAHTSEIIEVLPSLLKAHKGTLVLFSSKKQMNAVYDTLNDQGLAHSILVQGQYPKREILKIHSEKIALGHGSSIFGLASFGEGVDLPGELCSQVIITKIPFAPPDTPIEMAVQEWVESQNGNPFSEVSLPKAGLKLTQWVGRLIRSETDYGRIVFLDSRMYTARYRHSLLSSLPEFTVV